VDEVAEQRRAQRAAGRRARARITGPRRTAATRAVVGNLLALPEVAGAARVLLTVAVGTELDLAGLRTALLARGTTVALPVVVGDGLVAVDVGDSTPLQPGWRGVPEPLGPPSSGPPDVVVVPALALDRRGGRLGYGGGHFDRFLAGPAHGAVAIGAVFDDQLVARVPVQPHDVHVDVVVTEHGSWRDGRPVG
jgi:5-formyltetrahydrofolate cyclo-ligase